MVPYSQISLQDQTAIIAVYEEGGFAVEVMEHKPSLRKQLAKNKADKAAAGKLNELTEEEFAGLVFEPAEDTNNYV